MGCNRMTPLYIASCGSGYSYGHYGCNKERTFSPESHYNERHWEGVMRSRFKVSMMPVKTDSQAKVISIEHLVSFKHIYRIPPVAPWSYNSKNFLVLVFLFFFINATAANGLQQHTGFIRNQIIQVTISVEQQCPGFIRFKHIVKKLSSAFCERACFIAICISRKCLDCTLHGF